MTLCKHCIEDAIKHMYTFSIVVVIYAKVSSVTLMCTVFEKLGLKLILHGYFVRSVVLSLIDTDYS